MYTLVLAAFLTTGNAVPDWGRHGGCHGCWGGCHGCWGCYGCWGGCYGCWGCHGCWGGCYGCYGCGGGSVIIMPTASTPAAAPAVRSTAPQATPTLQDLKNSIEELKKEQNQIRKTLEELKRARQAAARPEPERGKIVLEMPADALVVINDQPIGANAVFRTPPLGPGKEQLVHIEAAVVRDGKSINRVKQLTLHGGEVVSLAFKDMEPADGRWTKTTEKAATPAHITVHLPADAKLSVDGVDCPLTSSTRTFATPPLTPGQRYYYLLRAEVVREGRPITQTRRIDFRSGERVTVSFEELGAKLVTAQ